MLFIDMHLAAFLNLQKFLDECAEHFVRILKLFAFAYLYYFRGR